METKPLLYGLIGFFIGGLVVSIAATTMDKPKTSEEPYKQFTSMSTMSMDDMTADLKYKTGDEYDKAFVLNMIAHHEGAVEMAQLSAKNAKHDEIKRLSEAIITAQQKEIAEMKKWQADWGYKDESSTMHQMHGTE